MIALLTAIAIGLLAVSVLISRAARRTLDTARRALAADETALSEAGDALRDTLRAMHDAEQRQTGLAGRLEAAQAEVQAAQRTLEVARQAPVERYHVSDRLEPRHGTLWAVTVARRAETTGDAPWTGTRVYLVPASNHGEALERAAQRFPRDAGFEVRSASVAVPFSADSGAPQPRQSPKRAPEHG